MTDQLHKESVDVTKLLAELDYLQTYVGDVSLGDGWWGDDIIRQAMRFISDVTRERDEAQKHRRFLLDNDLTARTMTQQEGEIERLTAYAEELRATLREVRAQIVNHWSGLEPPKLTYTGAAVTLIDAALAKEYTEARHAPASSGEAGTRDEGTPSGGTEKPLGQAVHSVSSVDPRPHTDQDGYNAGWSEAIIAAIEAVRDAGGDNEDYHVEAIERWRHAERAVHSQSKASDDHITKIAALGAIDAVHHELSRALSLNERAAELLRESLATHVACSSPEAKR